MFKVVSWLILSAAGVLFPLGVLAAYDVTGSSPPAQFQTGHWDGVQIPATVEAHPETLNVKGHGRWVTAYIELPQGHDVGAIDIATVRLCLRQVSACLEDASVPARARPTAVGDHDHDGTPDRMVKFDRHELIVLLAGQTGDVTLTGAGRVEPPGETFAGSDTIRVIDQGCGIGANDTLCTDEEASGGATVPEITPTPVATPVHEATPAPAGPTFEYQVQPGDTLFDIALRFGAGVEALAMLNGLSSAQVVWVGQVLQVPGTAPASPPAPSPAPTSTPSQPSVPTLEYTVRPGESLSDVAAFFGTTVEVIAALNSLTNPNLVVPGERLLVPALPATTAQGREFMSEYVVQSGETLTAIAERFETTVEALAAANSLANPSAIRVGDHLRVP
jgi:LysM repeat protein